MLALAKRRACRGELGRQQLERRDQALGARDPVGRTFAVVRRERIGGSRGRLDELVDAAQALALGRLARPPAGLEPGGVFREGAQLA